MFGFRHKLARNGARAGVSLDSQSVAIAALRFQSDHRPVIEYCELYRCQDGETPEQALKRALHSRGAKRTRVFAAASADDYQLLQLEAPEVPATELRSAIRWRLRDMIDFAIEDAVVDVFESPEQPRRGENKTVFAVAARSAAIKKIVDALAPIAPGFDAIDIPELCARNLSAQLPQDQNGLAMLLLGEQFAQLTITRQGALYLARRIEYARGELSLNGEAPTLDVEAIGAEVRRSLDYYAGQFNQTPIRDVTLAPAGAKAAALLERLAADAELRVEILDLSKLADGAEALGEVTTPQLLALGAALRADNASA